MKTLLELFITFFKIGGVTFGGGLAMLPILQREIIYNKNWATEEELLNYYAVSQCTPGIIAVNTATFVGYKKQGFLGSLAATLGIITPSLIIILCIASFIKNFNEYTIVHHIFRGIKIAVAALLTEAVLSLFRKNVKSRFNLILFLLSIILNAYFNISPIYIILIVVFSSIIGTFTRNKHLKGEN